jgi:collagenase-like PrtC family protease
MITFYLPDFYYFYKMNRALIEMIRRNPEYFKYDLNIGAVYGCFPNQIWNGGRAVVDNYASTNNIEETIRAYNETGTPVRFTYTNCLLEKEHLDDKTCNFITDVANNGMNEILVNSPILEEYLRKKYPNFKYISSATRCIRDVNKLNEMTKGDDYYLVLGDYRDNFDFDFLSKIEDKDKIEILINPYCKQDCKIRDLHYKVLSQIQLNIPEDRIIDCPCEHLNWYDLIKSPNIIKDEDLQKYIDMGFSHFKIEGRNMSFVNVIDSYVYYLVKPEYVDMVRNILLQSMTRKGV